MNITIDTEPYNERRYGKPWIALVDFTNNTKGDFTFGDWVGSPGYAGMLIIEAQHGDVVAIGQKDHRKPRNSAPVYHIVNEEGNLELVDKVEAYKRSTNR